MQTPEGPACCYDRQLFENIAIWFFISLCQIHRVTLQLKKFAISSYIILRRGHVYSY